MDELPHEEQADQRMAERLLRDGVCWRHVRRILRELRDHRSDLVARRVNQGFDREAAIRQARIELGDRDDLAARILARPELRSRARRLAWLWFLVAPLPMVIVVGVAALFAAIGLYRLLGVVDHTLSDTELVLMRLALQWLAPATVGLVLGRVAVRHAVPAIYPLTAILLVALISSTTYVSAHVLALGRPLFVPARGLVLVSVLCLAYLLMTRARWHRGEHRA